jgi:alpha-beta hydrolase superfamily lysophospholipase
MVKIILIVIFSVLGFSLLAFLFLLAFLAHHVAYPKLFTMQETEETEKKKNLWFAYDEYRKEEIVIPSFDGYLIHGTLVFNPLPSQKYVIISHGYTYTRYGSLKYLDIFIKEGYNVFIYDDRGHGENKRTACTMGLKEGKDLNWIIAYIHRRFGDEITLGLHGESMGAALSLMALKFHPKLDFVFADCPYEGLEDVLAHQLKIHFHLPKFLVRLSGKMGKLLYGYDYCRIHTGSALKGNRIPICFMHGIEDTFVPCQHSERLAKCTEGYSEVHLFPGAEHALSFTLHPEEYRKDVHEFLEKIRKEK